MCDFSKRHVITCEKAFLPLWEYNNKFIIMYTFKMPIVPAHMQLPRHLWNLLVKDIIFMLT